MTAPLVSVVMGVYNGADPLEETVLSILSQVDCDLELIAIDDGSQDGSAQVLARLAAADARLRVITQANAGLTRALVRGCNEARGEFIARQDVGDISLPMRLSLQARALSESPQIAFVSCAHRLMGPAGEPLATTTTPQDRPAGGAVPDPHHGSVMFRRSAYLQAGGYRPEFYFAQDVDLWSRMIEIGGFRACPEVLYEARFDLDSITARHRPTQQALRALIDEATALRRSGASDAPVLARAAALRPEPKGAPAHNRRGEAAYFVGSCLAQQNDPRARRYLLESLRSNPLHVKSWLKLARLALGSAGR
ncbi:MAG: glycosyltransferase [Pseudomonadota bacterium]